MFFFCFCHVFTVFINDNRNREKITHESCDDREFREVVGIGASKDRNTGIDATLGSLGNLGPLWAVWAPQLGGLGDGCYGSDCEGNR